MGVAQVNTSNNVESKKLVIPDPMKQRISYYFYLFEQLMIMVNCPNGLDKC